jgi:DNA-binding winged helix-turn-helix (wHTH) protein
MPSKERRGKWQPYDALEGYKNSLREAEYEKGKISRPALLPDKIEEMNRILQIAYSENRDLIITYYRDGYLHKIEGIVERIDQINGKIKIRSVSIKLRDIIDIEEGR